MKTLCDACIKETTRESCALCAECAKHFRVIFLPSDIRSWSEIVRDAQTAEGAEAQEIIHGMMVRMFNQQRELARLNMIIDERERIQNTRFAQLADCLGASVHITSDDQLISDVAQVVQRYMWLRDDNGYAPEENFVRGGYELDDLCDAGIEEAKAVPT